MDDLDWDAHVRAQAAARIADEKRIAERERRRVARDLGLEYVPSDEPVPEPEPMTAEPVIVTEPEPEFDVDAIKTIFEKLLNAALRR